MATKRKNTQSLKGINSIDKITGEFSTKDAATATSSSSALLLLLPCAVLTAALPGYIFSTAMFDMPLDANQVVFGAVTLVTVVMLVMAYINLADARYLAKSSELGINSTDKKAVSACFQQTLAFSVWKNNVMFIVTQLFISFVMLKGATATFPQINYVVSTVLPAGAIVWLSTYSQ